MDAAKLEPGEIPTTILHHLCEGECQTIDQIVSALRLTHRQVSNGAGKLILRNYLERVEIGCYQLTRDGLTAKHNGTVITSGPWRPDTAGTRKPVRDTFRQRLWSAMRMSGAFTIGELVMAASRDDADPENHTGRYLRYLKAAGYVVELPVRAKGTHQTSNGFKRYRLLKNTGPTAPLYQAKHRSLHDYNSGEDIPCNKPA